MEISVYKKVSWNVIYSCLPLNWVNSYCLFSWLWQTFSKCFRSYLKIRGLTAQLQSYPSKTIPYIPRGYQTDRQMDLRPVNFRDCFSVAEIHWALRIHPSYAHLIDVLCLCFYLKYMWRKENINNYLCKVRRLHNIQEIEFLLTFC